MCSGGRSVLMLLRRCVAVRPVPAPTGIWTRGSVLSGGFIRPRSSETERLWERTSSYSYCTKTDHTQAADPCVDEYPPLPAYQADPGPEKKEVYIVLVKGLPWSCSTQDLLQFFSECQIRDGAKGIHLTVDQKGRPTGKAFIEMQHPEDVLKALEKHRQYLGPRYVEVSEVTNSDAEVLLKSSIQMASDDGVVRLRGLPFTCTEADVAHFFSGLDIVENGITIVSDRGRRSGEAFVQFSSQEAANEALKRDREVIGNRYIEVFPSRSEEVNSWRRRMSSASPQTRRPTSASALGPRPGSQSSFQPLHQVHMRGLPFQASGEDIVKFFSPLIVLKILMECGPNGRPSGEADVYFRCHQDATAAMSRHRQHIGERYIELFLNSEPESEGR
ncbi:G-rich sequence factor 1 [Pempheris klunzingeri]|uniref:G-rich sequence factor 1 n=1 Tax=Pempheris klunzingeri TaxID=3127111 RepID=UPI0039806FB7